MITRARVGRGLGLWRQTRLVVGGLIGLPPFGQPNVLPPPQGTVLHLLALPRLHLARLPTIRFSSPRRIHRRTGENVRVAGEGVLVSGRRDYERGH